jgi:hypothetical protein
LTIKVVVCFDDSMNQPKPTNQKLSRLTPKELRENFHLLPPEEREAIERIDWERRAKRSRALSDRWHDPTFRQNTLAAMKEGRANARWRSKMRKAKVQQAALRAAQTGVVPHWAPKRVRAVEPNGGVHIYGSICKCAAHYGIQESNMRAILKNNRTWNDIRFAVLDHSDIVEAAKQILQTEK